MYDRWFIPYFIPKYRAEKIINSTRDKEATLIMISLILSFRNMLTYLLDAVAAPPDGFNNNSAA